MTKTMTENDFLRAAAEVLAKDKRYLQLIFEMPEMLHVFAVYAADIAEEIFKESEEK